MGRKAPITTKNIYEPSVSNVFEVRQDLLQKSSVSLSPSTAVQLCLAYLITPQCDQRMEVANVHRLPKPRDW